MLIVSESINYINLNIWKYTWCWVVWWGFLIYWHWISNRDIKLFSFVYISMHFVVNIIKWNLPFIRLKFAHLLKISSLVYRYLLSIWWSKTTSVTMHETLLSFKYFHLLWCLYSANTSRHDNDASWWMFLNVYKTLQIFALSVSLGSFSASITLSQ